MLFRNRFGIRFPDALPAAEPTAIPAAATPATIRSHSSGQFHSFGHL